MTNCVRQVLSRMKRGVFLSEGGSEFFTVFEGQEFKAGARVVNFGKEAVSNLHVAVKFLNAKGAQRRTVLDASTDACARRDEGRRARRAWLKRRRGGRAGGV